jgi:solute carrier family 25 protein 43
MGKSYPDSRLTYTQALISGGVAGILARCATSPLEVVKTLSQVGTKETREGTRSAFSKIYQREGIKAFWKVGNRIKIMDIIINRGTFFLVSE